MNFANVYERKMCYLYKIKGASLRDIVHATMLVLQLGMKIIC